MNGKVSIIMPTYNDAKSICESIDSVINQTYKNWELIIVDDGSTDNTKNIIENYIKQKENIKYIYQENADQLNAIIKGTECITGDYVYIAHSDDLLNGNDAIQKCVEYMNKNIELDAIISDILIIDEKNNISGVQKVKKYINKDYVIPLTGLWLGRNIYVDVAFYRKKVFLEKVKYTYLNWNMPFWLDLENSNKLLNIKKVDFRIMKYRVSDSNYINNEIGKLNVINGELRTLTTILYNYNIAFYKLQYYLFRILNKLNLNYRPIYTKKTQKKIGEIIKFTLEKRFNQDYKKNIFLKSICEFYCNMNNRTIAIKTDLLKDVCIYFGKDMRKFNNDLINNNLSLIYIFLFDEMQKGFSEIIVENEADKNSVLNIIKFLAIYPFVKIKIKGE